VTAFDYVWARLIDRLDGLSDDEYFWEPVRDCWTIRRQANGTWRADGQATAAESEGPPPFTTIAWRVCHIGVDVVGGFAERLFAADAVKALPGSVDEVAGLLSANYAAWRNGLTEMSDEEWSGMLGPQWGPYATDNKLDVAIHVFDEVVHHSAEVAVLRDLYAWRASLLG